ncbi:hypothetical protein K438DRAFT_1954886 [Mycena galopus ATCC 62051]|nr:hypothetical protein K438DRAFT_1954886 [Mycena galopus ATCC 62051]
MSLIPLRKMDGKLFTLEEMYEEAAKAIADMKDFHDNHPNMLLLSEITDADREKHRRDMWALRKREKMDETSRVYRERAARQPINYSLLPPIRRPLRIINRKAKVNRAKDSDGTEGAAEK